MTYELLEQQGIYFRIVVLDTGTGTFISNHFYHQACNYTTVLHGKQAQFAFSMSKFIIYYFVLNNQSLKLAHKCCHYSDTVWMVILGRRQHSFRYHYCSENPLLESDLHIILMYLKSWLNGSPEAYTHMWPIIHFQLNILHHVDFV